MTQTLIHEQSKSLVTLSFSSHEHCTLLFPSKLSRVVGACPKMTHWVIWLPNIFFLIPILFPPSIEGQLCFYAAFFAWVTQSNWMTAWFYCLIGILPYSLIKALPIYPLAVEFESTYSPFPPHRSLEVMICRQFWFLYLEDEIHKPYIQPIGSIILYNSHWFREVVRTFFCVYVKDQTVKILGFAGHVVFVTTIWLYH